MTEVHMANFIENTPDQPTPPKGKYMEELESICNRLATFDSKINQQLRSYPKQDTACSVLAHKTYMFLPESITNPRIRTSQFEPDLNSYEGEMLQISLRLNREMKMQILESSDIPSYAKLSVGDDKLVLKVKSIEMELVLFRTKFGYQWFIKLISLNLTKDKSFHRACLQRLYQYFVEVVGQLNNLDEVYYDYEFLKQHFLSFIGYCCQQAIKYLSIARLFKQIPRIKESLRFQYVCPRVGEEAVEYVMTFDMPHSDNLGKFHQKSMVTLGVQSDDDSVSISMDIDNLNVCQSTIVVLIRCAERQLRLVNNIYKGDMVYSRVTRQFVLDLIDCAQQARRVYLGYCSMKDILKQSNPQSESTFVSGLVIKLYSSLVFSSNKAIEHNVEQFLFKNHSEKVFLLTFSWLGKSTFYQINPQTLQLMRDKDLLLNCGLGEFGVRHIGLQGIGRDQVTRVKHMIFRDEVLRTFNIQGYRIHKVESLVEEGVRKLSLGISHVQNIKYLKSYTLKIAGLALTFAALQIQYKNQITSSPHSLLQEFLAFSNTNKEQPFSIQAAISRVLTFLTYHDEIKRAKAKNDRPQGVFRQPKVPKIFFSIE